MYSLAHIFSAFLWITAQNIVQEWAGSLPCLYKEHALSSGDSLAFISCKSALPVSLQCINVFSPLRAYSLMSWHHLKDQTRASSWIKPVRYHRVPLSYQILSFCELKCRCPADTTDENGQGERGPEHKPKCQENLLPMINSVSFLHDFQSDPESKINVPQSVIQLSPQDLFLH